MGFLDWLSDKMSGKEPEKDNLKGLGGWLGLFQFGFIIGTLFILIIIAELPKSSIKFYYILFLLIHMYLLYLFYTKNKRFPKYIKIYLAINLIILVLNYLFNIFIIPEELRTYTIDLLMGQERKLPNLLAYVIWYFYFEFSVRVHKTFVR